MKQILPQRSRIKVTETLTVYNVSRNCLVVLTGKGWGMARGDLSKQERYTSGVSYGESSHLGLILKAMQNF